MRPILPLVSCLLTASLLSAQGGDPSLRLWLRSDAGVTVSSADGRIDSWTDQSGSGAAFTATGTVRPEWISDGTHSHLRFQGGQELAATLPFTLQSATILALFRYRGLSSSNDYLYSFGAAGSSGSQMPLSRRGGTRSYHYDGRRTNYGSPIPSGRWTVSTQTFGDGGPDRHTLYLDGALAMQSTAQNPYSVDFATSRIGDWSGCCYRFRGDLMELLVYDRVLSANERAAAEARLLARVQSASVTTYGTGCSGSAGRPTLVPVVGDRPVLGTTFDVEIQNTPALSLVLQGVGFDDVRRGGASLPISLAGLGLGSDCFLYVDVIDTLPTSPVGGVPTWSLPIPNDPALARATLHAQAFVFDAPANSLGITLSNAMTLSLGM